MGVYGFNRNKCQVPAHAACDPFDFVCLVQFLALCTYCCYLRPVFEPFVEEDTVL